MERELKQMFEIKENEMSVPVALSPELHDRIGRQRMIVGGLIAATACALAVGGLAGARSLVNTDATPVQPAEENQKIEPMLNGSILQANSGYWAGDTAPPAPAQEQAFSWNGFDQDTGSFLYYTTSQGRMWVVDEEGLVAEIDCPSAADCGRNEMDTFGPGPDEITVPSLDRRSVHVIGFDGTLRDTLDISAASLAPGQDLSDLAWSPDGRRLGVSTEFEISTECDASTGPCGTIWIFDRDGGEPRSIYTERSTQHTVLRDLAWSPDGETLALLVAPSGFRTEDPEQALPRLVALRVAHGEQVRAKTLNVYDDYGVEGKVTVVPDDYHVAFPFAWAPDGTRLAIIRGDEITEISAESGEILARHPGEGPEGPLAWLPKR